MKRKSVFLVLAILLVTGGIAGFAYSRFLTIDRALRAVVNDGSDLTFEPKYDPGFLKGIPFTPELITLAQNHKREVLVGNDLVRRYEELNYSGQAAVLANGNALMNGFASSAPILWKAPETIDICAAAPDLKRVRDYVRMQAFIGRYLIAKGRKEDGILLMKSVAYIGAQICQEHPERVTLILQMIARAVVGIAAESFILAAADLRPDRDQAKAIGSALLHANTLLPPLSHSFRLERKVIPSFPAAYRKQAARMPSSQGARRAEEFELVAAKAEPHLKKLIDPWIPAMDLPWPEGSRKLSEAAVENEKYIKENIELSGPVSYFRPLIDPYEAIAGIMLSIVLPSMRNPFWVVWNSYQKIEGAQTVLAMEAFRREKDRLPATMAELSAWWGEPIGRDIFSGKPLAYDSKRPALSSAGKDQLPDTSDDIRFLPLEDLVK